MLRAIVCCMGVAVCSISYLHAAGQEPSTPTPQGASGYRTVLNRYCITCHNQKLKTAGLMLDQHDVDHVAADREVWEKVIRKLRTGAMPPAGMPRPEKAVYDSFATYLETALDREAEAKPNPGRPVVHRLNRAEYTNAIRDLLSIEIDGRSLLPADDSGYGFDNIGDALMLSPTLLDRYLAAAETISNLALGDPATRPADQDYRVPLRLVQDDRVTEDLPLGLRGGMVFRHTFPLDAEYVIKLRLRKGLAGEVPGLNKQQQIDLYVDDSRIKRFVVGGEGFEAAHNGKADEGLEARVPVKAGTRTIGVGFLKESTLKYEGVLPADGGGQSFSGASLDGVVVEGPHEVKGTGTTASRRRIFVCTPKRDADEHPCVRKIVSTVAERAYRRPVSEEDIQPLLNLYQKGRKKAGVDEGIRMALEGILVSPNFLFRIERDPKNAAPDSVYEISQLDLASRLSFFIWSSIPDNELLETASHGKLSDPAVLEQQVQRMLRDPRSRALIDNFGGQWLYLRNMGLVQPDPAAFPEFNENLRQAFQKETGLFLESILREDRSVLDLLRADYTFLNDRLARHYGVPNIYGSYFRRVTLTDENRRGLLGQGSILTVTSYPGRTAPTLRGKWVLENILGAPPPPPPPNVPSLKEDGEAKLLTMRQRMEQHRANPACSTCHARMDPLGFALENFDGIGKWRTTSGTTKTPIDASGLLPDGTKFSGPAELRAILLNRGDQFVHTFTEKLLTYALGRGVEYYDYAAVRKIIRDAATSDYRWSSLILGIVRSRPFQMRRSKPS